MKVKKVGLLLASTIAAGLIAFAPFYNFGVFFTPGMARTALVGSIVLLLLSGWFAISYIRRTKSPTSGLRVFDLAVAAYISMYFISVFYAASPEDAIIRALGFLVCGLIYVGFRVFGRSALTALMLPTLAISSVFINIVGMANGWHELYFPSAFDPQFFRVQSVFQYHNAYGAYTGAIALAFLVWATLSRSSSVWKATALGCSGLNLAGLVLSNSRGAQALWVVSLVIVIIGLRPLDLRNLRARLLLNLYSVSIGSGIGYILLRHAMKHDVPSAGWFGVALALIIPTIIRLIAGSFPQGLRKKVDTQKATTIFITIGVLILGCVAVFARHMVMTKLASYHLHQLSVSQRFIFWEDAWHIALRDPLFGSGGSAWQALWQMYQSYPYYSTQSHSFIMDIIIDVGLVGFVLFLASLWPIARIVIWPKREARGDRDNSPDQGKSVNVSEPLRYSAERRSLATMSLFLILHSAMDWDMAFLSLQILLFVGIAAAASLLADDSREVVRAVHLRSRTAGLLWGLVAIVSLGGGYLSLQTVRAQAKAVVAAKTPDPTAKFDLYTRASSLTPWDPQYNADRADVLLSTGNISDSQRAVGLLITACRRDPFNADLATTTASTAFQLGEYRIAYMYAMDADKDAPFISQNLSTAINAAAVEGLTLAGVNREQSRTYFQQIMGLYAEFKRRQQAVASLPPYLPPLGGSFELEPFCYDSLAAACIALGNISDAQHFANTAFKSSDTHTRDVGQLILLMLNNRTTQPGKQKISNFVSQHPDVQGSYKLLTRIDG